MEKEPRERGADWRFWVPAGLALALLFAGLLIQADPGMPDALGMGRPGSNVPLRYLDLVAVCLAATFLYLLHRRREGRRQGELFEKREATHRAVVRQFDELTALFEISTRAASFRDVEKVLDFVVQAARESLGGDRASVYVVEGDTLVLRSVAGDGGGQLRGMKVRLGAGVPGWVAQHFRPLLLNTQRDLDAFYPEGHPDRHICSEMCVPLLCGGEAFGVLSLCRFYGQGRARYEQTQLRLLTIFADYAAQTIGNLRTYREMAGAHSRLERSLRDLKKTQEDLERSQRAAAIAQLAEELDRDLSDPLTSVVGHAQLLARAGADTPLRAHLDRMVEQGLRCREVVSGLLDRARLDRPRSVPLDVNEAVREALKLRAWQLSGENIEVETDLAPALPRIRADEGRFQQVILNLLSNARRAVLAKAGGPAEKRRGRIRIQTRHLKISDRIQLKVSDDGPGIPEGQEGRIFEPFFTTSDSGHATGLGLAICRGVLEGMGGRIAAGRDPDLGGACFRLDMPPVVEEVDGDAAPASGEEPARGKRILVVDADEGVRDVLARMLRLDGHQVAAVEGAPEAIQQLDSGGFDLILSGADLPGMTGLELFQEIERKRSELQGRVIFTSGALSSEEMLDFLDRSGRPCLRKPLRLEEVRRSIREVLRHEVPAAPPAPSREEVVRVSGLSTTDEVNHQAPPPDVSSDDPNLAKARRLARRVMERRAAKG